VHTDMTEDVYNLGLQVSWELRTSLVSILSSA
jgi:hypothetical protein